MGLLRMAARTAVVAGTATAVSGRVARRQAARYDDQQYAQQPQQYAEPQQYAPGRRRRRTTQTAQLQKLAALHTQGVLTDDEFSAAKAKILGL